MEKSNSVESQKATLGGKAYLKVCDAMGNGVNSYLDSYYNGNIISRGYNLVKLGFIAVAGVVLELKVADENKPEIDNQKQFIRK